MGERLPALDIAQTIVLVGKTGNGKSATGNTILNRKAFTPKPSSVGVTKTSVIQSGVAYFGQHFNVIDTPGMFDPTEGGTETIATEMVNFMKLAHGGIHAILFVLSIQKRFSKEEEAAFICLKALFGPKITDYMIIIFTSGDALEDCTFAEYVANDIPEPLKDILNQCENRIVLMNNKTTNAQEKLSQEQKFWDMMNLVISRNNGQPYREKFAVQRIEAAAGGRGGGDGHSEGYGEVARMAAAGERGGDDGHSERYAEVARMGDGNLNASPTTMEKLLAEEKERRARAEKLLAEEKARRARAEKLAEEAQKAAQEENRKHYEKMERAQIDSESDMEIEQQHMQVEHLQKKLKAKDDAVKQLTESRQQQPRWLLPSSLFQMQRERPRTRW